MKAAFGVDWVAIDRAVGTQPGWAVHPGEVLSEWLADQGRGSRARLARSLDVAPSTVTRLASGEMGVSVEMASRLEQATGVRAIVWLHLQAAHDLSSLGAA